MVVTGWPGVVVGSVSMGFWDHGVGGGFVDGAMALPMKPIALAYQPLSSPAVLSAGLTSTSICTIPGIWVVVTFCCHSQLCPAYVMSSSLLPACGTEPDSLTVSMRFKATQLARVLSWRYTVVLAEETSDSRTAAMPMATMASATNTSIRVNPLEALTCRPRSSASR